MTGRDPRLDSLTPAQRRLLELRLARRGGSAARPAAAKADPTAAPAPGSAPGDLAEADPVPDGGLAFGLLYFSSDGHSDEADKYGRLFETVRAAERLGFESVWTPERHFQAFGGLFPNPAVLGAALARETERLKIRAGSVVVPLHEPLRIVEEWALVDNLSGGRVGLSLATGWNARDFALRPERFADRRTFTFEAVPLLRALWRGERVTVTAPDGQDIEVQSYPRPLQPELPLWLTVSGSEETWQQAARLGANVLTSLLGQGVAELGGRIAAYRRALARHGHDPARATVTVMAHAYLDPDPAALRATVRGPLSDYLRDYIEQYRELARRQGGAAAALEANRDDEETLIDRALERFLEERSLIGTPETVEARCRALRRAGVDEVACLVDFGIDTPRVLESLQRFGPLLAQLSGSPAAAEAP